MFHLLSKSSSLLLTPSNAVVLLILAGLFLSTGWQWARLGRRLMLGGAVALFIFAVLPVGDWLLSPLERRFPAFQQSHAPVAGIIVLGGSVSVPALSGGRPQPSEAIDRVFEAARLARRFPTARVIVSGGPIDPRTSVSEADWVANYLTALGVEPARITRERTSRDTYENARYAYSIARPRFGGQWLLVTSAFHMPRAVSCFRHAGFEVQAAPANWLASRPRWGGPWSASGNLRKVDIAVKEYLGLLAYRLRGRTSELIARP